MSKSEGLIVLVIALSLASLVSGQTTYSATFDTIRKYTTQLSLGYVSGGYTIEINITVPGASTSPIPITNLKV